MTFHCYRFISFDSKSQQSIWQASPAAASHTPEGGDDVKPEAAAHDAEEDQHLGVANAEATGGLTGAAEVQDKERVGTAAELLDALFAKAVEIKSNFMGKGCLWAWS